MFNEREALKIRLEQLVSMEEKIVNLYREERKEIFIRLRELDNLDREPSFEKDIKRTSKDLDIIDSNEECSEKVTTEIQPKIDILKDQNKDQSKNYNGLPKQSYFNKKEFLRDATVAILKKYNVAIPLKQLKYEIETETGIDISNMSLFMTRLVKSEETIQKAKHGQYMYINS